MTSGVYVRTARRGRIIVGGLAVAVVATSCSTGSGEPGAAPADPATPTSTPSSAVAFDVSVPRDAKSVRPDAPVTVAVETGKLAAVQVTGPGGKQLRGRMGTGGWQLVDPLAPATTYVLTATAAAESGAKVTERRSFTTLTPKTRATYHVGPDGGTYGVGMPVSITFDSGVNSPQMRAAVERRLTVKTVPAQQGSWGWNGANQVLWRPKTYWKPKTEVTVTAALTGVQTGEQKWTSESKGASFAIADRARISTVDLAGHTMTVRENGKKVHVYAISGGKPYGTYQTRSGTKIITEKNASMVMDAASLGVEKDDPNYYRQEVDYAMRVTNTGEFLHSAPWSVWAQGRRNVSHGCVNMGPSDARNMFSASMIGDVVDFTGSDRRMRPEDGMSVWLFSWPEWQARSALAAKPAPKTPAQPGRGTPTPTPTAKPSTAPDAEAPVAAGTEATGLRS